MCRHGQDPFPFCPPNKRPAPKDDHGKWYDCDCCGRWVWCNTPGTILVIVLCAPCNKGREIS
jgi:hypothetical protein